MYHSSYVYVFMYAYVFGNPSFLQNFGSLHIYSKSLKEASTSHIANFVTASCAQIPTYHIYLLTVSVTSKVKKKKIISFNITEGKPKLMVKDWSDSCSLILPTDIWLKVSEVKKSYFSQIKGF